MTLYNIIYLYVLLFEYFSREEIAIIDIFDEGIHGA